MKTLKQFIKEDSEKLIVLSNSNCFFNNFITFILSKEIDPVLIFGSFLGFSTDSMLDSKVFLGNYLNYHFNRA